MRQGIQPDTQRTCAEYQRMIAADVAPSDAVSWLASEHGVTRPSIWRRLRIGGILPPYNSRPKPITRRKWRNRIDLEEQRREMPRVDRDGCPRCGVRGDIGCKHSRAPLGMML